METNPIVAALQREQASALVLFLNYKKYHWLTYGPHFRDLHLLFEEHGTQVLESLHELAGKMSPRATVASRAAAEGHQRDAHRLRVREAALGLKMLRHA